MTKNYIRDNGKIRYCNSNIAKMNIFEYILFDIKTLYFRSILEIGKQLFNDSKIFAIDFVNNLFSLILFILFPITLPLRAIIGIRSAKKELEKQKRMIAGNK